MLTLHAQPLLTAPATRLSFHGDACAPLLRDLPVEAAVNIIYAPVPYAVMMATPQDLTDFAYGFSLTEGVIDSAADIRSVDLEAHERGVKLTVTLASQNLRRHLGRTRAMSGRTGCGVCGVEDLSYLPQTKARAGAFRPIALAAIHRALEALSAAQPLNAATHAVHAAAFADRVGKLILVREDVGRHNALDKMIGAAMQASIDPSDGFVLITSRCSFEMVEKAAVFGAGLLVAISAPTSLAVARAQALGLGLMAVARQDAGLVFCQPATIAAQILENMA